MAIVLFCFGFALVCYILIAFLACVLVLALDFLDSFIKFCLKKLKKLKEEEIKK